MKENIKPVRTERSGSLRVAVNGLAGRKSKWAICLFSREEQFGENVWCETYISSV